MNSDTLKDDLAFMKALAEDGGRRQWAGGAAFLAGGLLYGGQCLVQWAEADGLIAMSPPVMVGFVVGVTLAFLIALAIVLWKGRNATVQGFANKAFNNVFAAAGLANLVLVIVFAVVAIPRRSIEIWEIYPAALFTLQGAAWYIAFQLRKRLWLLAVAVGWFASALAAGLLVGTLAYVLVVALALLAFMAVPGAYMMHLAKKNS